MFGLICAQVYRQKGKHVLKDCKWKVFFLKKMCAAFFPWLKNCFWKILNVIWTVIVRLPLSFQKNIKDEGGHSKDSFETLYSQNSMCISAYAWELKTFKNLIFAFKKLWSLLTIAPTKSKTIVIPTINSEEDAKRVFLEDWFIHGQWVNFQCLEEEGFPVKGLFDCVGWTPLLEKFSSILGRRSLSY